MAHTHGVYDGDTHFEIDPITRRIKNTTGKVILMQNDHNSERFTFEMQRTNDGHDMSLCNKVEVHYINIDAKTKEQTSGVYPVDDLQTSEASDDVIICSWLISQNATKYAGTLSFVVRFACVTDGIIDYQWFTDIHKGISVCESISNGEAVLEEHADILAQWEERVAALANAVAPLVVKDVGNNTASHSSLEIQAYVDAGGTVVFENSFGGQLPIYQMENSDEDGKIEATFVRQYSDEYAHRYSKTIVGEDKRIRYRAETYEYGRVNTVNGVYPDEDGNVKIETAKTVNGVAPDKNGNVKIDVVKTINGSAPDKNGNFEIPEGFSGSWNDLTDNPFVGGEVILEEITLSTTGEECYQVELSGVPALNIGDTYNAIFNGVTYRFEVLDDLEMGTTNGVFEDEENCPMTWIYQGYKWLGNDEYEYNGTTCIEMPESEAYSFTFSITKDSETLNEKYLPYKTESWTFELSDGTTVEKQVVLK